MIKGRHFSGWMDGEEMKANVFGYVSGHLGYNVHTQGFIEGMINNGIDVKTTPLEERMATEVSSVIINSIKKKFSYDAPSICLSYGNDMNRFHGKRRIGYTVWETTKLPQDWVEPLNNLDDVWTVSKHSKMAIENSGVKKDVKIVPEGVDTTVFNNYVDPLHKDKDTFIFLFVGKWEKRKSPDMLLKAFADEFKPEEKVRLAMQCFNPFIQNFNPYKVAFDLNLKEHAPIVFLPPAPTRADMAKYYKTADVFVSPTRGESWGLPIIEAMACGTPVIATNWGGHLDYFNDNYGWLLDVDGTEMPEDNMFFKPQEGNEWAKPSITKLRELLRYTFEHKDEVKKKGGMNSYKYVDENWTWEKSTSVVKELLKE